MITRLHSARVDVPDFDGAVEDHARMLGFRPARRERDSSGRRSAFFVFANTALELRERDDVGETVGAEGASPRSGLAGLRFDWEDGDPTDSLAAAGVVLESPVEHRAMSLDEATVGDAGGERSWTSFRVAPASSRRLPVEIVVDESPPVARLGLEPALVEGAEDPGARVHALDHVVVLSPAPDETRAFYGDGLGLRLALDRTFDERGVRLLFFRLAGLTVEIGARKGLDPAPEKADRFGGLAWQVPDVDAIQARLAASGFDVSPVRTGNKPGTRVCTVRDPVHGVPTLLIQPVQPIPAR